MANIVELRDMPEERLQEKLENAHEEMFNLRFQQASARLEDASRIKAVRREIAQLKTVLHARQLAVETAVAEPAITQVLIGKNWQATAKFDYEESAWLVEFSDEDGGDLANAVVDLNKKQPRGRRERAAKGVMNLVTAYEIAG